ncbi:MAG: hypothetical protein IKO05_00320 [Selenomonadaceae bacterium]|nr:hypothetical protein [Selenomonadaceae bacterium]
MTEQEKQIVEVEKRVDTLEAVFKSFMQEMRDRDKQRADDIREIRQDMKNMQTRHDADMKGLQKDFYTKMDNMDKKMDGVVKHVQNLTVAAIVGIGAAVAGIGAIAVTVVYSVLTR